MGKRPQPEIRKGLLGSDIGLQELIDGELCPLYAVFPRALWPCWPCSWRGRSTSQTSLPAGPWRVEHCSWCSPLDRFLSSPLRHPCSRSFSSPRDRRAGLGVSLRQEASLDTPRERGHQRLLAFPICSQRKGNGRKFYPPRVLRPHLPPRVLHVLPSPSMEEPCRVQEILDSRCGSLPRSQPVRLFSG